MQTFESNIIGQYGKIGEQWVHALPSIISQIEKEHHLTELSVFPNLSWHYVLSAVMNEKEVVLKLGLDTKMLKQEALALSAFSGKGAIKLLHESKGYLITQKAQPGDSLIDYFPYREMEALEIVWDVMTQLHHMSFEKKWIGGHVRDWLRPLEQNRDLPQNLLKKARVKAAELLSSTTQECLLHGDLHHDNILQNGHHYISIDPKGVWGEPAFEVAAFIRNPTHCLLKDSRPQEVIHNRICFFAERLHLNPNRILDWCFVHSMLCWIWAKEDKVNTDNFKKITELFNDLNL
jgi:streptomycin 6-kinase